MTRQLNCSFSWISFSNHYSSSFKHSSLLINPLTNKINTLHYFFVAKFISKTSDCVFKSKLPLSELSCSSLCDSHDPSRGRNNNPMCRHSQSRAIYSVTLSLSRRQPVRDELWPVISFDSSGDCYQHLRRQYMANWMHLHKSQKCNKIWKKRRLMTIGILDCILPAVDK